MRKQALRGKKLLVVDGFRRCEESGCDTVLSKYNKKDLCFRHQPMRRPRLRGTTKEFESRRQRLPNNDLPMCYVCTIRGHHEFEVVVDGVRHLTAERGDGTATLCEDSGGRRQYRRRI